MFYYLRIKVDLLRIWESCIFPIDIRAKHRRPTFKERRSSSDDNCVLAIFLLKFEHPCHIELWKYQIWSQMVTISKTKRNLRIEINSKKKSKYRNFKKRPFCVQVLDTYVLVSRILDTLFFVVDKKAFLCLHSQLLYASTCLISAVGLFYCY